jgi:acyl carrier protein
MNKKDRIRSLLSEALPLVDLDAVPLFNELDSLGVTMILMILSKEYGIDLESQDATPEKLWSLDSIVALVESKLAGKK